MPYPLCGIHKNPTRLREAGKHKGEQRWMKIQT